MCSKYYDYTLQEFVYVLALISSRSDHMPNARWNRSHCSQLDNSLVTLAVKENLILYNQEIDQSTLCN